MVTDNVDDGYSVNDKMLSSGLSVTHWLKQLLKSALFYFYDNVMNGVGGDHVTDISVIDVSVMIKHLPH